MRAILPVVVFIFVWFQTSLAQTPRAAPSPPAPLHALKKSETRTHPPVFKKHAVIMLAINFSEGEIEAARSAAKARGEQFVLLPEMTQKVRDYARVSYEGEILEERIIIPLQIQIRDTTSPEAREILKVKLKLAELKRSKLNEKIDASGLNDTPLKLSEKIHQLEKAGILVDSLVISGHDGGGNFSGTFATGTDVNEISDLASKDPIFKQSLRSVYLLGCYTATTDQVRSWKEHFPNMEMVAGYDQTAPLRDAPKGHHYLQSLMEAQKKLTTSNDLKKLNQVANAVTDINKSGTAFGVFPQCKDPKLAVEFYYRGELTQRQVAAFHPEECSLPKADFEKNNALYHRYENGSLPLPSDTANSPLRDLYTFYRNHAICYELRLANGPTPEEVFFLLFNRGVRSNFSQYFASDMTRIQSTLATLDLTQLEKTLKKRMADLTQNIGDLTRPLSIFEEMRLINQLKLYEETDWNHPLGNVQSALDLIRSKEDPRRTDLRRAAQALASAVQFLDSMGDISPAFNDLRNDISDVSNRFNNIVIARRGCIPMSWHEESRGMPQAPKCDH